MQLLVLIFFLALNCSGFQSKKAAPQKTKEEIAIQALVTRLAALPFEMEADGLLILIESGQIPKGEMAVVLDRLFLDSNRAAFKSAMTVTYPTVDPGGETVTSAKARASSSLGLDQLTIQARVISKMRETDLKHAVELFDSVRVPQTSRSCSETLLPTLDRYYQALLKLYQARTLSKDNKMREGASQWLGSHLSVQQEAQIVPVAHLIVKLAPEKDLFELSLSRFSQDLANLDPSFISYVSTVDTVTEALLALSKRASESGSFPAAIWRSFALFHRKALTATRCAFLPEEALKKQIQKLQSKTEAIGMPPEAREIFDLLATLKPDRLNDSKPDYEPVDADSESKELLRDYAELRVGAIETRRQFLGKRRPDGLPSFLSLEERKTIQWDEKASQYLRKIERSAKDGQSSLLSSFIKTSERYSSLIQILPISNTAFSGTLSSYLAYLSASPILKESPLVWLVEVKLFLRRGTLDEHDDGQLKIREAIRRHGSEALNILLEIDRYNPIQANSNMSTLYVHVP